MPVNLNAASQKAAGFFIAYFGRKPDASGLEYWSQRIEAGVDAGDVADRFADSNEARARFDFGSEPGTFVDNVYSNLFGRQPDDEGRLYWIEELEKGTPPGQLVVQVLFGARNEDAERIEREVNRKLAEVEDDRDEGVVATGTDDGDTLEGSAFDDELTGLGGDDTLIGLAGDDTLDGGDGQDTLYAGSGDDTLTGGADADTFVFDVAGDGPPDQALSDGDDTDGERSGGDASGEGDTDDQAESETSSAAMGPPEGAGPPSNRGPQKQPEAPADLAGETFDGGNGRDVITGTPEADYISGGNGPDELDGMGGNDVMTGGNGPDKLDGGAGDDEMAGGLGPDKFHFVGETGDDVITDFFTPTDTLVFATAEEPEPESRVVESTITVTNVGEIADTGELMVTIGDATALVAFDGGEDAAAVAAKIVDAVMGLDGVLTADVDPDDETVVRVTAADGSDVEVTDITSNDDADISTESAVVTESSDDTTEDSGQTEAVATTADGVETPLTLEITKDGDSEIVGGDTVSVEVNGTLATAELTGGEAAAEIAAALATAIGGVDDTIEASADDAGVITVTSSEDTPVDLANFTATTQNEAEIEGEIEGPESEDESDDDDTADDTEPDVDDDDGELDLPDGVRVEEVDGDSVVTHAGGTVTLKNVGLDELSSGNFRSVEDTGTDASGIGDNLITDFELGVDTVTLDVGDGEDALTLGDLDVEALTDEDGAEIGVTLDTGNGEIQVVGDVSTETALGDYVMFA